MSINVYEVSSPKHHDGSKIVCARSPGAAKYSYWLCVSDCMPDMKFGEFVRGLRVHVVKTYKEPQGFRRCVESRGISFAKIGMTVTVEGRKGTIVGHNDSSNLDVLFDGDSHAGNCHPWWKVVYFDDAGREIDWTLPGRTE